MPKENLKHIQKLLAAEDTTNYRLENNRLFKKSNKTCIVIDDDPTGNQTVYDVPLLTSWSMGVFVEEFIEGTPVFFILTNSRSLSAEETAKIYTTISENILKAAKVTKREYVIISRSDSTLRGHFPLEPKTLRQYLKMKTAITVFIPVMFEGKRVTVNNTHYIADGGTLTPVNETPFSKDHSFAYSNANLKAYIEEKSSGGVKANEVFSFSLQQIRSLDVRVLAENILEIPPESYCVFDSLNYSDLDKICQALLLAEQSGKQILYRTSSSFIPSYIGLAPKPLLKPEHVTATDANGGLTIVGSYVKKSSQQLHKALEIFAEGTIIEVDVERIRAKDYRNYISALAIQIDANLQSRKNCIVYTSRKLVTGVSAKDTLDIASKISAALVDIVRSITVRPKYIIAKGGITSHDLAIKGLRMKRSSVLGQLEPGVPLWKMGMETKFPKLPYIVFPGNVGDVNTLKTIITKLNNHHD